MILQTGGLALGATSTRSRSASAATRNASSIRTMPTCSPPGPINRTSGTRMRSLTRVSVLMGPPLLGFCFLVTTSDWARRDSAVETPHHQQKSPASAGPSADRSRLEMRSSRPRNARNRHLTVPVTGPLHLEIISRLAVGVGLHLTVPGLSRDGRGASLPAIRRLQAFQPVRDDRDSGLTCVIARGP